jgi:DNA (cytosine-5)-methyltransferase 1
MKVISLFSGGGGLDLGFEQAGFEIAFANEYDRSIWATYESNFRSVHLDRRSITDIPDEDIPEADGVIGGPPCQSWSEAGAHRGIEDRRGQLFFEYIRVLRKAQPRFFLAENVSGILSSRHRTAFSAILEKFDSLGYRVQHRLLNASHHGVPQDRERVIIVGIRHDVPGDFQFPEAQDPCPTLRDAIHGMPKPKGVDSYSGTASNLPIANHEFIVGGFSPIFLSRNRVRSWDEPSFTIQAGGRHAPLHPSAPRMERIGPDQFRFVPGKERLYRRMSVRECARVQTFPDDHRFVYDRISDGYKMVGNAVPVELARRLAVQVRAALADSGRNSSGQSTAMSKTQPSPTQPMLFEAIEAEQAGTGTRRPAAAGR